MDLYAPHSTEKKPLVSRDVGEISTNDALFQEQAATAVAAAASPHSLPTCCLCGYIMEECCHIIIHSPALAQVRLKCLHQMEVDDLWSVPGLLNFLKDPRTASCHVGRTRTHLIIEVKQRWSRFVLIWPTAVRRCTSIFWPGKASEKTPRGVIPPVYVKYCRMPQ
jgi:hypothetical protein